MNSNKLWEVDYNANKNGLTIYFWNGAGTRFTVNSANNLISANTWYSIEVQDKETTSGHGEIWLNGTSIGSVNADLSVSRGYAQLVLLNNVAGTDYFDDIKVSNNFI